MSLRNVRLVPRAGFTLWVDEMSQTQGHPDQQPQQHPPQQQPHAAAHSQHYPEQAPPSSSNAMYTEESGMYEMQPPRLPQRSGCNRVFLLFSCVLCCVAGGWIAAACFLLPGIATVAPTATKQQQYQPVLVRPLPATLRRFGKLRKNPDASDLRQTFPSWFNDAGVLSVEDAVRDLASALTVVAERLGPPALRPPPPQPPPPPPVPAPSPTEDENDPSEEDEDL